MPKPTINVEISAPDLSWLTRAGQTFNAQKKDLAKEKLRYTDIETYARKSHLTLDHGSKWGKYCIFPFYGFAQGLLANELHAPKPGETFVSQLPDRSAGGVDLAYCELLWGLTANVFRLNPKLDRVLSTLSCMDEKMPAEVLKRLPDWCIFMHTPNLLVDAPMLAQGHVEMKSIGKTPVPGFFAYVDFVPEYGPLLNLLFVNPELKPVFTVHLRLDAEAKISDCYLDNAAVKALWEKYAGERIKAAGEFKGIFLDAIPMPSDDVKRQAADMAVNMILTLCSSNALLVDVKRKTEIKRLLLKSEKDFRGPCSFKNQNRNISILSVGDNIELGPSPELFFELSESEAALRLINLSAQTGLKDSAQSSPASETAVKDLEVKLEAARTQTKAAEQKFSEASEELKRVRISLTSCETKLKETEAERDGFKQQVDALSKTAEEKNGEYEKLKKEVDDVLKDNLELTKQNEELKNLVEPQKQRIATLTELTGDLQKQNAKLNDDIRNASDGNQKYIDMYLKEATECEALKKLNKRLEEDLTETKLHLDEAHGQIATLSSENAKISYTAKSGKQSEGLAEASIGSEAVRKFCLGETLNVTDSLKLIEALYASRVTLLPSAFESAEKINSSYKQTKELVKTLFLLVNDYLNDYLESGDNKAREVFGKVKYCAQESTTVQATQKLMKKRVFSGVQMLQHLRIGYSERLYFAVDSEHKKIVIGYCGPHLASLAQ